MGVLRTSPLRGSQEFAWPRSYAEPRGARNPRLGQAKIARLRYAAVASPLLQSGQVQAGRPLNPLRGTAARLSCWLRSGRTLRLAAPHNIPRVITLPCRPAPQDRGAGS